MLDILSADSTTELTQTWERILGRRPIGPGENFFLLGGDRPLADSLFAEIEAATSRAIPSAAIDYAPTIASLSALLNRPQPPAYVPLVLMKPGSQEPPVFVVHGLGGSIGELYALVHHINTSCPIYGIEGQGIDGLEEPLDRIEDMAALYLGAIEKAQPDGPYLLIGYSLGGLIALEMAQRLFSAGKNVALLTMVDGITDVSCLSASQRLDLAQKRLQFHMREMWKLPFPGPVRYVTRKARIRLGISPGPEAKERDRAAARPLSFAYAWQSVAEKAYAAVAAYRPSIYRGTIRYVAADTESFFLPCNPASVWKRLAAQLEVETAPGDHEDLIRGGAAALGAILTRHIREAVVSLHPTAGRPLPDLMKPGE